MKNKLLYYTVLTTMSVCLPYYAYAESAPLCSGQGGSKDCNTLGFRWTAGQCASNPKLPCPMDKSKYFCNGAVTKTCMEFDQLVEPGLKCGTSDAISHPEWGITCYPKTCCDDGSGDYIGANDGYCRPTNCTVLGYLFGEIGDYFEVGNLCTESDGVSVVLAEDGGATDTVSCYPRTCCGNNWGVTAEGSCLPTACSYYDPNYTDDPGNCDYGVEDSKSVRLTTGNTDCYKCRTAPANCHMAGYLANGDHGNMCSVGDGSSVSVDFADGTTGICYPRDCCGGDNWRVDSSGYCKPITCITSLTYEGYCDRDSDDNSWCTSTYSYSIDCDDSNCHLGYDCSPIAFFQPSLEKVAPKIFDLLNHPQNVELASMSEQEIYKRYVANLSTAQDETDFEVYI